MKRAVGIGAAVALALVVLAGGAYVGVRRARQATRPHVVTISCDTGRALDPTEVVADREDLWVHTRENDLWLVRRGAGERVLQHKFGEVGVLLPTPRPGLALLAVDDLENPPAVLQRDTSEWSGWRRTPLRFGLGVDEYVLDSGDVCGRSATVFGSKRELRVVYLDGGDDRVMSLPPPGDDEDTGKVITTSSCHVYVVRYRGLNGGEIYDVDVSTGEARRVEGASTRSCGEPYDPRCHFVESMRADPAHPGCALTLVANEGYLGPLLRICGTKIEWSAHAGPRVRRIDPDGEETVIRWPSIATMCAGRETILRAGVAKGELQVARLVKDDWAVVPDVSTEQVCGVSLAHVDDVTMFWSKDAVGCVRGTGTK
ncbi:MAG: hypothetical protein ACHREM_08175 [Polyangiales bacterium]